MLIGILLAIDHYPIACVLAAALGARMPLWERLTQFIADTYAMPREWSFSGQKY